MGTKCIDSFKNRRKPLIPFYKQGNKVRFGLEGLDVENLEVVPMGGSLAYRKASNQFHRDAAKGYWHSAWEGVPSIPDMINAGIEWYQSVPWLGGESEDEYISLTTTGEAPDFTPAKAIRAVKAVPKVVKGVKETVEGVKKAAKLISQARKEDKAYKVSKKVKTATKYGKGFVEGDARAVNSGLSKIKNRLLQLAIEEMRTQAYPRYNKELNRLEVKLAQATNPEVQLRIKGEIRALAKKYIDEGLLY